MCTKLWRSRRGDSGSSSRRKPSKGEMSGVCGDSSLCCQSSVAGQMSMLEAVTEPPEDQHPAPASSTQAMDRFLH